MSSCRPDAGPSPPTVRLGAGSSCGSDTCRGSQSYSYGASRPVGTRPSVALQPRGGSSTRSSGARGPRATWCPACRRHVWHPAPSVWAEDGGATGTAAPTRPASSRAQFWGKQLPGTCLTAPPKPTVSVAPGPASSPWGASLLTGGNGTGAPGFPSPFLGGRGTPWPQRGRLAAGGGTGTAWEEAMWPSVLGSKGITPRARMGWSFADLRHRRPAAAKEGNMEAGGQGPGQRAPSTPPPPAHPCCRTSSQQLGTGGDRVGLPLPGPPGLQGPEAAADPRLSSAPP